MKRQHLIRTAILISTIFLELTAFNGRSLYACNCSFPTLEEQIKKSDLIAIGRIISITTEEVSDTSVINTMNEITSGRTIIKYLLIIDTIYKGKSITDTVAIYSIGNGNCNYEFSLGEKYVVFGYKSLVIGTNKLIIDLGTLFKYPKGQTVYWTNKCTLTDLFTIKKKTEIETIIKQQH